MSTVTRSATFDAPLAAVWEAVSDPAALRAWLDAEVDVDLRPGGTGRVGERSVLVTEVEEDRRISMLWWGDDDVVSSVTFTLDGTVDGDAATGTTLTVVERLVTDDPIPQAEARWGCAFGLLATLVVPVGV